MQIRGKIWMMVVLAVEKKPNPLASKNIQEVLQSINSEDVYVAKGRKKSELCFWIFIEESPAFQEPREPYFIGCLSVPEIIIVYSFINSMKGVLLVLF